MESVHRPEIRTWIDKTVINIRKFKEEHSEIFPLKMSDSDPTLLENIISKQEFSELEAICSPKSTRCNYQEKVELSEYILVSDDVKLATLKNQQEEIKRRKSDKAYAQGAYYNSHRYRDYPVLKVIGPLKNTDEIPFEPVQKNEVLLIIQIYVPERKVDTKTAIAKERIPAFQIDFEFLVLGDQYLTEIRDRIECVSDIAISGELSECPDLQGTVICKDLYKSGFFYINGVFYNDMRDKDCRDYSEVILKWNEKGNHGLGPFKKASMENTKFIDLDIQLGYPYVYVHQGDCEHLIVFSDIRMLNKGDELNSNAYPIYAVVKASKRVFCMICHKFSAVWVVYDNPRLVYTKFFCCDICYKLYNYDKNDQKIGTFTTYHFPDPTKLA